MWNKLKGSRVLYVIFSVFLAILLWMYVDNIVKPETRVTLHNLPVTLLGQEELEAKHLMITDGADDVMVNLTLVGSRTIISQLNRNNVTIQANVDELITKEGETDLEYTVLFPAELNTSGVKVRGRTPEKIRVSVRKTAKKTVPVTGEFAGSVAVGYLRAENAFELGVKQLVIEGESESVNSVDHAVVTLEVDGLRDTWTGTLPIKLVNADGEAVSTEDIVMNHHKAEVVFRVNAVKELPLTVSLKEGGGATAEDVTTTIEPASITVTGPKATLDALQSINLGTVDLGQVITSEKKEMSIATPEGCANASADTHATVMVKINKELVTRKLDVTNIILKGIPEGYNAQPVNSHVSVRVRGDEESMNLLMPSDIQIVADLSKNKGLTGGNVTVSATVKVIGFADIGVMGNYDVTVRLS